MTEQSVKDEKDEKDEEYSTIGKIEPLKVTASEDEDTSLIQDTETPVASTEPKSQAAREASLLDATLVILRQFGIRKSRAAVRDAVEMPHDLFSPAQSVSALSMLGFKASFGSMALRKMTEDFFPLIAFKLDGTAVVIKEMPADGLITIISSNRKNLETSKPLEEFTKEFAGFVILVKEMNKREKEDRSGHWFFGAFRKSKWLYFQVAIAAMVSNFLSLTTSLFTMTVYDRIIPNGAFESLFALSIGVVIALGFDFLIKSLRANFIDKASKRADLEISRRLFDRILSLSPSEQKQKTGAMAGTIREFETLREFFNSSTLVILIDLPFVFFFIYVISLIAGPLSYIPLIAVPLVFLVGLGIQPFLSRITRGSMEGGMNKQAVLVETLNGLETVNATGSGKLMKKRYEDALNNQSDSGNKARVLSMFVVNFAGSVQQYAQVALIFYGVYLVVDGVITQGALIGAVILAGRTMAPLSLLANALSRLNGALTSYRVLSKLIGTKFNSSGNLSPISRPKLEGEIEFKNVSYQFEGTSQPVLNNLSFKIPAGQKVALVGKMGSGKSTLSRLIAGIYAPTQGSILIDGVDVRQIDPADIRKNVGVMLQDSWLFSGTVRENIQMGFNEYDDQHVLEICKIAGVDDFVGSHPKGYDLEIRERGNGLSGGQKQAINLARSLLHNPKILLLDEPTSSMDQGSEKKAVDSLNEFCADKTMLIITHRNPIFAMVDRVLILESGKIVADQTPKQLGMKKV